MQTLLDLIQIVIGLATVVGLGIAAWQVYDLIQQRKSAERTENDGVALMWTTKSAPYDVALGDRARWTFEFIVTNPGRMPISDVHCVVHFGREVERLHTHGAPEPTAESLELRQAVLTGNASRTWTRKLGAEYSMDRLDVAMTTVVEFTDVHGIRHRNIWPISSR